MVRKGTTLPLDRFEFLPIPPQSNLLVNIKNRTRSMPRKSVTPAPMNPAPTLETLLGAEVGVVEVSRVFPMMYWQLAVELLLQAVHQEVMLLRR